MHTKNWFDIEMNQSVDEHCIFTALPKNKETSLMFPFEGQKKFCVPVSFLNKLFYFFKLFIWNQNKIHNFQLLKGCGRLQFFFAKLYQKKIGKTLHHNNKHKSTHKAYLLTLHNWACNILESGFKRKKPHQG